MIKLTDLIKTTNDITEAAQPSQFAMHAFTRDQEGLLTYTKALWANTSESIELTDGSGLAFNSLEDFERAISNCNNPLTCSELYIIA